MARNVQGQWKVEPITPAHSHVSNDLRRCKRTPRSGHCLPQYLLGMAALVRNRDSEIATMRIFGWRMGLPRRPKWIQDHLDTLSPEQLLDLERPPAGVPDDEIIDMDVPSAFELVKLIEADKTDETDDDGA